MPLWLSDEEYAILEAACGRMFPPDGDNPGAVGLGAPDYIDMLLAAFTFDPPRIWAGGPTSGRYGGDECFRAFHRLNALDELAWRTRIEGSLGIAEREFNGPVTGYQEIYRRGLAALGGDFAYVSVGEQRRRLESDPEMCDLLFHHCCEGMYGAPEYGGNTDCRGWEAIGYAGDVQPRGWTDAEVEGP